MKFEITYKKRIENFDESSVIRDFKNSFEKSNCDSIEIIEGNMIVVKNRAFRFVSNHNIWIDIKKAELKIDKSGNISYCIDYSRMVNSFILICFFFFILSLIEKIFLLFLMFFLIAIPIGFLVIFFLHRHLFYKTILLGTSNVDRYNWKDSLKEMTYFELQDIVLGKGNYPDKVKLWAQDEILQRGFKNDD